MKSSASAASSTPAAASSSRSALGKRKAESISSKSNVVFIDGPGVTTVNIGLDPNINCVWKGPKISPPFQASFQVNAHEEDKSEMFFLYSDDKKCDHGRVGRSKTLTFEISTYESEYRIRNWFSLQGGKKGIHNLSKVSKKAQQKCQIVPPKTWVDVIVEVRKDNLKYIANGTELANVPYKESEIPKSGYAGFASFNECFLVQNFKISSL